MYGRRRGDVEPRSTCVAHVGETMSARGKKQNKQWERAGEKGVQEQLVLLIGRHRQKAGPRGSIEPDGELCTRQITAIVLRLWVTI